jgi:hypothetical protein
MPVESHTIMDGKVHVYKREHTQFWQCAVYLGGRNHRATTRHTSLALALDYAREWYMDRYADERLRRRGVPVERLGDGEPQRAVAPPAQPKRSKPAGPTFREAAESFIAEYKVITHGERNAEYVAGKSRQLNLHLLPFFGDRPIAEVTAGLIQEYRVHRVTAHEKEPDTEDPQYWKRPKNWRRRKVGRPARATLHSEMVTLRQVLKTANRKGWIVGLPDMSAPYKTSGKVSHRA